jgi:hypothetical protein
MQTQHTRPFTCTFHFSGCEQTFGSKNEWKRHVFSQHLQLHYWRCDHLDCGGRSAIFNRKDLFGQHLKRMHGPKTQNGNKTENGNKDSLRIKHSQDKEFRHFQDTEIPKIQERCLRTRRAPPEWSQCGYCLEKFEGEGSWDQRMEHVGKHYEKNSKGIDPESWVMDEGLVEWAIEARIVEKSECGKYKLLFSGKASIEGEEKRKNSTEKRTAVVDGDDDDDADGELE